VGRSPGPTERPDRYGVELVGLEIRLCQPADAAAVHRLTQLAFREYGWLDPPSAALKESEESVRDDLERSSGALALVDELAVGCLRFDHEASAVHVRRVAVDPARQRQGIGKALMVWVHDYAHAHGYPEVSVGVRRQLPGNLRFYERLGYTVVAEHRHPGYAAVTWIEMRRGV
jgi:predicted N-acetyltransferase YhbS